MPDTQSLRVALWCVVLMDCTTLLRAVFISCVFRFTDIAASVRVYVRLPTAVLTDAGSMVRVAGFV